MKKLLIICFFIVNIAFLDSCSSPHYVSAEMTTPAYDRPVQPGPDYVWIDGDWYWNGGVYTYRNGYWGRPRGHRNWSSGGWTHGSRGYYWKHGRWH